MHEGCRTLRGDKRVAVRPLPLVRSGTRLSLSDRIRLGEVPANRCLES